MRQLIIMLFIQRYKISNNKVIFCTMIVCFIQWFCVLNDIDVLCPGLQDG